MQIIRVNNGEVFIKEGEMERDAFFLESGSMEVSKNLANRERQILATLKEGDVFGEMGLISGQPRSTTVTGLENFIVIKQFSDGNFEPLVENNPRELLEITKALSERLRATLEILEKIGTSSR